MPYIPVSRVLLICFSSVTLILLFYYLFFFLRLALRRNRAEAKPDDAQRRPISLVICAFNEEANLTKNLPLWLKQDYLRNGKPCFEVLVINDNSEDDTFYLLNRMCEEYAHLRVVHLTAPLLKDGRCELQESLCTQAITSTSPPMPCQGICGLVDVIA